MLQPRERSLGKESTVQADELIWRVAPAGAAAWQNALQIRPRPLRGARYRHGLRRSWVFPLCDRRQWCERLALRGRPSRSLPARLPGLTARFTRLGLIDREGPAFHLLALELGHRRFGRGAIGHLDKAKAFGAAGVAIRDHPDLVHHTIRLEELAEVAVGGAKRQIAYINIHGKFSLGKGIHDRQVIRTVCRSTKRKSNMQEKGRESLGITRHVLWFRRTATREYHKRVLMEREEHVSAQVSENVA